MINEIRTLLLNLPSQPGGPGEEYIPPEFVPRILSGALERIRTVLFGQQPDRFMFCYRAAQLLPLIHASPVWGRDGALPLDPRISYRDNYRRTAFAFFGFVAEQPDVWQQLASPVDNELVLQNPVGAAGPDRDGRCRFEWQINCPDDVSVRILARAGGYRDELIEPVLQADGLSEVIPFRVPGLTAGFRCRTALGQRWSVNLTRRPRLGPAELLTELRNRAPADLEQLWSDAEPLRSARELFRTSPDFAEQLSGVLVALVLRTRDRPVRQEPA